MVSLPIEKEPLALNSNKTNEPITPKNKPESLKTVRRYLNTIMANSITAIGLLTIIMAELMGFVKLKP